MLWKSRRTPEVASATLRQDSNRATIRVGSREFSIVGDRVGKPLREHGDFALFALAAIGMTHNVKITLDAAVTRSALQNLRTIGQVWQTWAPRNVYPLQLDAHEVIDDDSFARQGGMLCMSGGVDSTYAALRAQADHGFTHALLIAGGDYRNHHSVGFQELKERVASLAKRVDLELVSVATDLAELRIKWGFFHPLFLSACLRYSGSGLSFGGYAADVTDAEEFVAHPWGNNHVVANLSATPDFPLNFLGRELGRSAKVRAILADQRKIISDLSVCYSDKSTGKNCGKCEKCIRTRLNIATSGRELPELFTENIDLVRHLRLARVPCRKYDRICMIRRMYDVYWDLPNGPLREASRDLLRKLVRPRGEIL